MTDFRQYAEETTIHGIGQLTENKSWAFRIIWCVVLVAMAFGLVFELQRSIRKYVDKPTATEVGYGKLDEFPAFSLCTNEWPNPEKLQKQGLVSAMDKLALLGPMCPTVLRSSDLVHMEGQTFDADDIKSILEKIDTGIAQSGTYENLLRSLMYDFEGDLGGSVRCKACIEPVKPVVRVKDVGPCWFFNPGKVHTPGNRVTNYPVLDIDITFPNGSLFNERSVFFAHLGCGAVDPTTPEDVYFTPYASNIVDVMFVISKRVSRCNPDPAHTDSVCESHCFAKLSKDCNISCNWFMGESDIKRDLPNDRYCNWITNEDANLNMSCFYERAEDCQDCRKKCEHLSATTTVSIRPKPVDRDMRIRLRMKNLYSVFQFREYYSYTATDLLSDFGGLLGLFLGASVISMVHTIYFCVILPFTDKKKEDIDENGN